MKRIFKILIAVFMVLGLTGCHDRTPKDDIYIFFTGDVHCGIDGDLSLASLKALVDETKAEHKYVTLVDCGDYVQGGSIGTLSKGSLIVSLMNDAGYDLVTLGNHEFDYGMEELGKRISEMRFAPLACNVIYTGNKENIFQNVQAYQIVSYGRTKVAFIGVLTPATITSSTPKFFMEDGEFVYDFYGGEEGNRLAQQVQQTVNEVKKNGADYVVLLSHLGSMDAPYDSITLISRTEGIDAVLDGHSHSMIIEDRYPNKKGEDVILSSVGTKLQSIGELIIAKDGSLTAMHVDEYSQEDEAMRASMNAAFGQLDAILAEKITDLDHDMLMTDEEGIRMTRTRETAIGNFFTDAIRYEMETDICVINGGSVRASLLAGELTYQDILNLAPFGNETSAVKATGQQILDCLEFGARSCERLYKFDGNAVGENGAFILTSGLKYTIDTSVISSVMIDDNGMFAGYENENRRVKDVMVLEGDEYVPLDPEKTYTVASSSYLLFNGGDGNTAFSESEALVENGPVDIDVLISYLQKLGDLTGLYTGPEGRITVE